MFRKYYLTVCLSPSVQKTLVINDFKENEVNRCSMQFDDASGKGVNVSRVLSQLGAKVIHLTQLGGNIESWFKEEVKHHGIKLSGINSGTDIRFCYTLINQEKTTTTELVEESRTISPDVEIKMLKTFDKLLRKIDTVIISGSKAPGFSSDIFPFMVKKAKLAGKKLILDIRGDDLLNCLEFKPDIIKPNLSEFVETFKNEIDLADSSSLIDQVERLMLKLKKEKNICSIITRGKDSLLYTNENSVEYIPVEKIKAVNTTGCGDAFTAGLAYYLEKYNDLKSVLLRANKIAALNAGLYRPGTIIEY